MLPLPEPSAEEKAHSACVVDYIQQQIEVSGGAISFAEYMQAALYAPGLGYYVAGKTKFGRDGDFVTAPEISSLFSQCLAKQSQQVLTNLTQPKILEFGAGSGIMAADILLYLAQQDSLPEQYWILEPSPDLQQLQRETLAKKCPQLLSRIKWLKELPKEKFHGVVLANEVLDAMPVELFHYQDKKIQQLMVNSDLKFELARPTVPLQARLAQLPEENFDPEYQSEINLWYPSWLASIANCLQQGIILLIDYGYPRAEYYHPQRNQGTLLCHYRHRAHSNVFFYPGIQDITAHVDFTAVAEAALTAGLNVAGFCHQAGFLLSCGITEMAVESATAGLQRLLQPSEMGEVFKIMALSHDWDEPLLGFKLLDQRGRL